MRHRKADWSAEADCIPPRHAMIAWHDTDVHQAIESYALRVNTKRSAVARCCAHGSADEVLSRERIPTHILSCSRLHASLTIICAPIGKMLYLCQTSLCALRSVRSANGGYSGGARRGLRGLVPRRMSLSPHRKTDWSRIRVPVILQFRVLIISAVKSTDNVCKLL